MKKLIITLFLLFLVKTISAQNFDANTVLISGESERVKTLAWASKMYLAEQGIDANFIMKSNKGHNDPTQVTSPRTDRTWIYFSHPYSGTYNYIQMSPGMLSKLNDPTSNLSSFKAIFALCPVQSRDALEVLNNLKKVDVVKKEVYSEKFIVDEYKVNKKKIPLVTEKKEVEIIDCTVIVERFEYLEDLSKLTKRERRELFGEDLSNRDIRDEMKKLLIQNKQCLDGKRISKRKGFFRTTGGKIVTGVVAGALLYSAGKAIFGGGSSSGGNVTHNNPPNQF